MTSGKGLYFPGLNGLRAIAAVAVLFSHTIGAFDLFGLDPFILGRHPDGRPKTTLLAGFGVSIFFALSGFLITYLLVEEQQTVGRIDTKKFYVRRVLRIWPLYYLYLLLALGTALAYGQPFSAPMVFFYVGLAANIPSILGTPLPELSHYWSLGVEEQFYAWWPWFVRASRNLLRDVAALTIALIVLKVVCRLLEARGHAALPYATLQVTRFQCMSIGALGALAYRREQPMFLRVTTHPASQVMAWGVLLLTAINHFHVASVIDNELISAVTVVLIMGQIRRASFLDLEVGVANFLGRISYGIYVIHPLVIFYVARIFRPHFGIVAVDCASVFVVVFVVTIGLAYCSFRFLEQPFLRLKASFASVETRS